MPKYNKSNIIILALLYNYISNKETSLKINDVEHFFNELNFELLLNGKETISEEEHLEQNIYQYSKNRTEYQIWNHHKLPYLLINMKREYIDILPTEVIEASLSPNVLTTINVIRDQIHTKTCLEPKYMLGQSDKTFTTKREKIKHLRKVIQDSLPTYNVNFFYSVEKTVIDIDNVIEEHEKTLELN